MFTCVTSKFQSRLGQQEKFLLDIPLEIIEYREGFINIPKIFGHELKSIVLGILIGYSNIAYI